MSMELQRNYTVQKINCQFNKIKSLKRIVNYKFDHIMDEKYIFYIVVGKILIKTFIWTVNVVYSLRSNSNPHISVSVSPQEINLAPATLTLQFINLIVIVLEILLTGKHKAGYLFLVHFLIKQWKYFCIWNRTFVQGNPRPFSESDAILGLPFGRVCNKFFLYRWRHFKVFHWKIFHSGINHWYYLSEKRMYK